jgi:serine/threonine protein kinase
MARQQRELSMTGPVKQWLKDWEQVEGVETKRGGQGVLLPVKSRIGRERGALKELRSDAPKSSERRQRMKKEVVGLKRAQGAGVPRVLDSNTDTAALDDDLFIVMEWVDGQALHEFARKPLPIDESLRIARDLALIVSRCHAVDVIHRDIKPDNIIVSPDGIVHLVDFGIAWIPKDDRPHGDDDTEVDQELGNRFLRLPEMAGGHERADRRSDVTFVVAILFYLLTRKKPYKLGHEGDGVPPHVFMRDYFPATTATDPRFGKILSIFDVGFKTYPNHRFASAAALIARIEEIMTNSQPSSDHDAVFQRFDEMMKAHAHDNHHHQMMALEQAAVTFEKRIRKLCDERDFVVSMMAGSPKRQGDAWVTSMRFTHKTQAFAATASHVIKLVNSDVNCVSGLEGRTRKYYEEPCADQRRLIEAVEAEANSLFASVLDSIMRRNNFIDEVFEY